jgi:hypothetical protein
LNGAVRFPNGRMRNELRPRSYRSGKHFIPPADPVTHPEFG